ncbi:MAG: tyrosine-type recombinase/integrase [Phycisphaerales bacterium]|nr:tyrosine-type recombinase/integrase [Phycisphaerales bacterium]
MTTATLTTSPVDSFLTHCRVECGLSKNTLSAYRADLDVLRTVLGNKADIPHMLTQADIRSFIRAQSWLDAAPTTIKRRLATVRRYLAFHGFPETGNVEGPKIPQSLPKPIAQADIQRMIEGTTNTLHRLVLELLYGSGLRASEIASVKPLGDGMIRVLGKGGNARIVPCSKWVADILGPVVGVWQLNLSRFQVYRIVDAAAERAGIDAHPHQLRHSFATHMLTGGADIRAIQEMMGHASVVTTQGYTKLDTRAMRATIEKYHPRERTSE